MLSMIPPSFMEETGVFRHLLAVAWSRAVPVLELSGWWMSIGSGLCISRRAIRWDFNARDCAQSTALECHLDRESDRDGLLVDGLSIIGITGMIIDVARVFTNSLEP